MGGRRRLGRSGLHPLASRTVGNDDFDFDSMARVASKLELELDHLPRATPLFATLNSAGACVAWRVCESVASPTTNFFSSFSFLLGSSYRHEFISDRNKKKKKDESCIVRGQSFSH